MNIAMFTNTFLPHVGGVAESVVRFSSTLRDAGHRVLVVAPWMEGDHEDEPNVVRVPAWEHIWKTDFSLPLPLPGFLHDRMAAFAPEVIHSHHPFLLGDTALRIAAAWDVPVVYTNHTQYDVYTHYLPWDSGLVKRFATRLAAGYANLCDAVIAPSESIRKQLVEAGVESPIKVIPTGVDMAMFGGGDGERFRQRTGIPNEAFLVGHVGRLTQEKNLTFLADAVAEFVAANPGSRFTIVGEGPCEQLFSVAFDRLHCVDRLIQLGVFSAVELADAYAAMDVFAFASVSETQGIVLVEAMAAGTPVVAIDAPGARELVRSGINGQLLPREDKALFAATLTELAGQPAEKRDLMRKMARQAANQYAMPDCANHVLSLYEQLSADPSRHHGPHDVWHATVRAIAEECQILSTVVDACARAARGD